VHPFLLQHLARLTEEAFGGLEFGVHGYFAIPQNSLLA
jgi:hypothetical protein